MAKLYDGKFLIERWFPDESGVDETVATAENLHVARAAFAKACEVYPQALLLLRQKAFVMERREP